jgi:hypothetical protein
MRMDDGTGRVAKSAVVDWFGVLIAVFLVILLVVLAPLAQQMREQKPTDERMMGRRATGTNHQGQRIHPFRINRPQT